LQLLYILLILLLVTRLCGEIAVRLRQPALVGELLSGIVLGLVAHHFSGSLPVLASLPSNEVFVSLTDLAIFFLILLAGVEMHPRELAASSRSALGVALGGMVVPLLGGFALGWIFIPASDFRMAQSLFLATALAITAVPVSVKVLMELGHLKTRIGQTIVSAAVFDDVLSLILLAALTAVIKTGDLPDLPSVGLILGRIAAFFVITGLVGWYLFPRLGRLIRRSYAEELEFSALLIAALTYALIAEALGIHFILGAFVAGLFFVHQTIDADVYRALRERLSTFTSGFFAPLFFASIGLHLDTAAAVHIPLFVVLITAAAFAGKLVGAGLPAYWSGLGARESLGVGVGMSARGAVELIVADIALRAGLFNHPDPAPDVVRYMFSAVVLMALVTTLLTPVALQQVVGSRR
jgi:Kef-type K+ transport system membrane component KefB